MIPSIAFDHYYRYDELTEFLNACAQEMPHLMRVESIGKSHEGRDIWLATVTNFETGPDTEKPAFWIDGNIHASEVSPATVCLLHIYTLLTGCGSDEDITRCLNTRAFYICPRVNPDGAEWALEDVPRIIRSGTRMYPFTDEPVDGFYTADADQDGRILQMRVPDPHGAWKPHPDEPRLLIRRDPTETGGTYYRLFLEGRPVNYDGYTIQQQPNPQGLDINRNFPHLWRQENEQRGAGPYPTSEPEVRAIVDFIVNHLNITGAVSFHTWAGVLLRPYGDQPDDKFPAEDLWIYQKLGDKGKEITGYPAASVYHEFRYHPNEVIGGVFDDWIYDHYGVFGWTVELWAPPRQAGITDYKYIDWYREHPVEDDLTMLKWSDEKLGGQAHIDWYPFDHPELGPVELGGWNFLGAWRNPPFDYLEKEIAPFPKWLVWHALISPRLELVEASAESLGNGTYRIRAVVENSGWLPAYVSKKALEKKVVRGVLCEIELPEGATLETGKVRQDIGQLEGRSHTTAMPSFVGDSTTHRAKVEWVIRAPQGGTVRVTARHDRAGTARAEIAL